MEGARPRAELISRSEMAAAASTEAPLTLCHHLAGARERGRAAIRLVAGLPQLTFMHGQFDPHQRSARGAAGLSHGVGRLEAAGAFAGAQALRDPVRRRRHRVSRPVPSPRRTRSSPSHCSEGRDDPALASLMYLREQDHPLPEIDQTLVERALVDVAVPDLLDGARPVDQDQFRRIVHLQQRGEVAVGTRPSCSRREERRSRRKPVAVG